MYEREVKMRFLLFLAVWIITAQAADETMLLGQWNSVTQSINNGTRTTEKEYLKFYGDHTFEILFLVTVQKGNAYVKDLRIAGKGLWKTRGNILVVVVKNVEVPVAGEVYGISNDSLRTIASTFHDRFKNDPIRILVMKALSPHKLVTENKAKQIVQYKRQP